MAPICTCTVCCFFSKVLTQLCEHFLCSVHNGTMQHNCVFAVQHKVQQTMEKQKLDIHPGCLEAPDCEGIMLRIMLLSYFYFL
jgi:hypothetical protein